ncbi:hypothetical protein [Cellulomonas humilata]|uniref:Uncharacterized protein n=1 Tax=Cellulomonas humilata TaxID=144055 RepID=A0ABU0EAJ3_9CELL|nr:hypothetical protein [Cellulomonas humilata]MDQ0372070.1 hypothetical protein [Cellulomonas humilata]
MGAVVLVLVASAVAIADEGTGGPSWAGERRTTVRGGRTFHDEGSCGGFAPLAGIGGGATLRPASDGVHACAPLGLHGVWREADLRTAAPGGRPTVGAPGVPTPARLMAGTPVLLSARTPARSDGRSAARPVVPPAARDREMESYPPGTPVACGDRLVVEAVAVVPADLELPAPVVVLPAGLAAVAAVPAEPVLAAVSAVLADGDPTRRRTGDVAERIDAPAADAPPAAATTVGDMRRSAWPGPAINRCCSPPGTPLALAGFHPPAADGLTGLRVPAPDGFAGLRVPALDGLVGLHAPDTARFADAYAAAAPVGGA